MNKRYVAIVIEFEATSELGILNASETIGNSLRDREKEVLPKTCHVIRSIEITRDMAHRTW